MFVAEPLLATQAALLVGPTDGDRFQRYLGTMVGASDDVELPLMSLNPMGGPSLRQQILDWDAAGAERVLAETATAIGSSLDKHGYHLAAKVGLVMSDDLAGGWTDRADHDMKGRFEQGPLLKRGWVVVPLWSSEPVDLEVLSDRARAQLARAAIIARDGPPESLGEHILLESRVAHLVERPERDLGPGVSRIFLEHRHATGYPTVFAFLQGDEAARRSGYDPLGVPGRIGPAEARAILVAAAR